MATVGFNMHKVQKGKVSSRASSHRNEGRNDAARLSVQSLLVWPGPFLHLSPRCSASLSCAALLLQVVIKVWDMGGQEKYRGMWERYCRGVEVIV